MNTLIGLFTQYGTRLLGIAQGTVAILCGANVIPEPHLKYWMVALAILTYWKGQSNANALSNVLPSPQPQSKVNP